MPALPSLLPLPAAQKGGFIYVEIEDDTSATLDFILSDGSTAYTIHKSNPRKASN